MSSECAPRQRTDNRSPGAASCNGFTERLSPFTLAPRGLAAFDHLLEHLPIPQRIHRPPETLVPVRHQTSRFDQAIERVKHKLFAVLDVIKNLFAKDKIAAVDPNIRLLARTNSLHDALFIEFSQVKIDWRMNGNEATNLPACLELIDHFCKWRIRQPVAVVGQKYVFILDKMPNRKKARSDIPPNTSINKRNTPFRRFFANNLNLGAKI